jgi:hypothetical protein
VHQNRCIGNRRGNYQLGKSLRSIEGNVLQKCEWRRPHQEAKQHLAARAKAYFDEGGTYSLGAAEPSPKKKASSCLTMTS